MSSEDNSPFMGFLTKHDQDAWWSAVHKLIPSIHDVDRDATQIWFYFWPLWLRGMMRDAESNKQLFEELEIKGNPDLAQQIDSSHAFVYGHRYWPQVKAAVSQHAASQGAPESLDLTDQIRSVATQVAGSTKVDESLLVGITAIGFMTLQQVGADAFEAAEGTLCINDWARKRSPHNVLSDRAKDDGGGLLGYLKGLKKDYKSGEKARIEVLTAYSMDTQDSAKRIHAHIQKVASNQ